MNRVIINFKVKKEQSFFGIEEVILDGQSFDPLSITASDLKTSKSLNLKGDGQNIAIQTTDILSFHCLAD